VSEREIKGSDSGWGRREKPFEPDDESGRLGEGGDTWPNVRDESGKSNITAVHPSPFPLYLKSISFTTRAIPVSDSAAMNDDDSGRIGSPSGTLYTRSSNKRRYNLSRI